MRGTTTAQPSETTADSGPAEAIDPPADEPDARLSRAAISVVTVAVVAVLLGSGIAAPLTTVAVVAGGLLFGWAGNTVTSANHRRRALGGFAASLGAVVLLAGAYLAPADWFTLLGGLAVLAAALATADDALGVESSASRAGDTTTSILAAPLVDRMLRLLVAAGVLVVAWLPFYLGAVGQAGSILLNLVTATALGGLVALQFELVAISILLEKAANRLHGDVIDRPLPTIRQFGIEPAALPKWVWAVLAFQFVALAFGASAFVDGLLALTGPVEPLFTGFVTSGLVHAPLLTLAISLGTFVFAWDVGMLLVDVVGGDAPKAIADWSGAVAVSLLALLFPLELVVGSGPFDAAGAVFVGLAFAAAVGAISVAILRLARRMQLAVGVRSPYATAAVALFGLAILGGVLDAAPLVVFVAIGAAMLVVDLGETAESVGRELGVHADSGAVVSVRAVVPTLVAAGAVLFAFAASTLLGPIATPAPWHATAGTGAVVLAMAGYLVWNGV